MRSWAVPKGPSMDPATKRLAVQVEDHSMGHNAFEGATGSGGVIVWDRGTYEQGGRVPWPEALERGHAVFVLHGRSSPAASPCSAPGAAPPSRSGCWSSAATTPRAQAPTSWPKRRGRCRADGRWTSCSAEARRTRPPITGRHAPAPRRGSRPAGSHGRRVWWREQRRLVHRRPDHRQGREDHDGRRCAGRLRRHGQPASRRATALPAKGAGRPTTSPRARSSPTAASAPGRRLRVRELRQRRRSRRTSGRRRCSTSSATRSACRGTGDDCQLVARRARVDEEPERRHGRRPLRGLLDHRAADVRGGRSTRRTSARRDRRPDIVGNIALQATIAEDFIYQFLPPIVEARVKGTPSESSTR